MPYARRVPHVTEKGYTYPAAMNIHTDTVSIRVRMLPVRRRKRL